MTSPTGRGASGSAGAESATVRGGESGDEGDDPRDDSAGFGRPPPALALDAALLLAVPAALLAVHYLVPPDLRARFALRHAAPTPATLLTSAYVHTDDAHLIGNLTGYALGSLYAYGLSLQADRRPWFRRTFLALVLVLPVPVNAASIAAFSLRYPGVAPVSRGFSGVVGGFVGFVLVALVGFLRARHGPRVARGVGAAAVLLLLLQVDYVYAGRIRLPVVALVLAGLALLGHGLGPRRPGPPLRERLRGNLGDGLVVALVAVVLGVLVANLFPPPASLASGDGVTDVFAHATGVVVGAALAAAVGHATR